MFNPSLRELFCLCLGVFFLLFACESPTDVGSDIFSNEELEVFFADDVELIARTVKVDSFQSFYTVISDALTIECRDGTLPTRVSTLPEIHYLGSLDDPKFGKRKSGVFTQAQIAGALPDYAGAKLDSMVLVLNYDTSAVYGDINEPFDVEIYRVLESIDDITESYTNTTYQISDEPIGRRLNVRYSLDSLNAFIPGVDSTEAQRPALRIPFDPPIRGMSDLPTEIFEHPTANASNDQFLDILNGLFITTSSENNLLVGLNITSNPGSRMQMFYTTSEGEKEMFEYFVGGKRFNFLESDVSGSLADLSTQSETSELLYVSGQDGFDATIDVSDVTKYQNFALNKAFLEFTISEPVGLEEIQYPPSPNLILSQLDDNNELSCINDMVIGAGNVDIGLFFGGELEDVEENGTVLRKYTMNVTSHIQSYLSGDASSTLVLSVDNRSDNVRRTVLFGPDHPTHPAKLKLTYTAP